MLIQTEKYEIVSPFTFSESEQKNKLKLNKSLIAKRRKNMNIQFEFIDKTNRNILGEGRNYGLGFAFCKRDGNTLTTIQPISPCKDYLNDVVYSEYTGKPFQAHGLHTKKRNIFDHGEGYLVFSVCPYMGGGKYSNYDRDLECLKQNEENVMIFINWFEEKFGLKERTIISKLEENKYLAVVPLFWTKATFLISLYSFLIRIGIFYDGKQAPMDYFANFNKDSSDQYMINSIKPKLEKVLNGGKFPKQDMNNLSGVHSNGICALRM